MKIPSEHEAQIAKDFAMWIAKQEYEFSWYIYNIHKVSHDSKVFNKSGHPYRSLNELWQMFLNETL